MKKILFFVVLLTFINSCTKSEDPKLEFLLTYEKSTNWKSAKTEIKNIFFDADGRSNLQHAESKTLEHNLQSKETFLITNAQHWAMELKGIKPDIYNLELKDNSGKKFSVKVPYIHSILLDKVYSIEQDNSYIIEFTIDLDKAVKIENGSLSLDLKNTKVKISNK